LATHDLGGGQYFVNNLAKDITTISLDPPDPETPQNECRRLLTDVINSPTANEAVKSDAVNALALLEAHDDPGAALLTRRVIDGIRSLPLGDPARRIAEREVDSMIHALGTVEVP
jgi:hypothetical protein